MKITERKPIILIIDDEPAILKMLKDSLEEESYDVHTLNDPTKALALIGQIVPDLILLDIFMPQMSGLDLLAHIRQEYPVQDVMVISGFGTIPMALDAVQRGARDFIEKPLSLDDILSKIAYLKEATEPTKKDDTVHVTHESYGIIGRSYLFNELMHSLEQVATLDLPLLLYGEQGVGKSLLARYAHDKKFGADAPFYQYDCQQELPLEQLKSTFAAALPATIYLSHVHALSTKVQQSLAGMLYEYKSSSIRVIASSSKPLFSLVKNALFNSSLFNFFNITPLEIPSINKRRYDIPLLVEHFLQQEIAQQEKTVVLSAATIRLLRNTDWVGNVAQLEAFIKTVVSIAPEAGGAVTPEDIQRYLPDAQPLEEQRFSNFATLQDAVSAFEKQFLLYTLKKNKFDIDQAADCLNLNVSQLRDKILELKISYKH